MKNKIIKNKGFTILEAIIAVSIITIGIISLLIFSQNAVLTIYHARNNLTAVYLAKEGMENIRNIRDQNLLRGANWNSGISSRAVAPLFIDDGFYNQNTGTPTKFTREIIITSIPNFDGINVRTIVRWAEHSFSIEENLYNWR